MAPFKKLTKTFRKSPKHPTSLGISSHISSVPPGITPELDTEGANNEEGPRIALTGDDNQRSNASGTPASTDGPGNVTSIHEPGRAQEVLQNAQNEQLDLNTPDLPSTERESEDRNQETVAEQPTEIPLVEKNKEDEAIGSAAVPNYKAAEPGFGSLKTVMSVVLAKYGESVAIRNKGASLCSRIDALEQSFHSCPSDRAELNRRFEVIRKFEDIEGQLRFLSGEAEPQRVFYPVQDLGKLSGLLEDLQQIIFDYRMEQQMAAYKQGCNLISPVEAAILNGVRSAQGVEYRHGDRKGCLKGTREAILDGIELWTRDFSKSPVYWLNGLAGTGKTTIAQTIAERTFADGQLGASFFCSRDFEDRSDLRLIFPTLAVQLARRYIEFRSVFVPLVQSDPGIAHESLYNQMDRLIVQPLTESAVSTVIVIDALDECKDEETTSAILSVLGRLISKVPTVKIFLAGRPEPRIQTGFRLPLLKKDTDVFVLHNVEPNLITSDVRLFFKHSFLEIANSRGGLDGWPTDEEIERLCERAAGLFVYAVATVKFIDKRGTYPTKQLRLLLQSPESSAREAKTEFKTNTSLDSLYTSILQEAFGKDDDPDNDPRFRSVIGTVLLAANPLSPSTIATLLNLDIGEVFALLSSAQSLLILQDDINCPVRPFHKSFPDFITDPARCTNQRFRISPTLHHSQLLIGCLDLMDRTLKKNMCKLPDAVANSDVDDLKERTKWCIAPALQYACRSWYMHLVGRLTTAVNTPEIISALQRFLEKKFLFWLDALSVLGSVRNAVDALHVTANWLEESPTLDLTNDCSLFVTRHFEIISTSSPHIYHSALMLTPRESIVSELYKSHAQPLARVVRGRIPAFWDSNTAAAASRFTIGLAVWSPCNRFIAISPRDMVTVDILDSTTLQRLQSLDLSPRGSVLLAALVFSPDSCMLASFIVQSGLPDENGLIVSWDLQTGGVVSTIQCPGDGWTPQITYSRNGNTIAALFKSTYSTVHPTALSVYDVVSGVYMHDVDYKACANLDFTFRTRYPYKIWTYGESLRFTTPGPTGITIWEVEFTSGAIPTEVEIISIPPTEQYRVIKAEFHPSSCRLAFITQDTLRVWDARASKFLLHHTCIGSRSMTFSSDGNFFACRTGKSEVHLWKESPTGYTLLKLSPVAPYSTLCLPRNGESIITFSGSTIQSWNTKNFTTVTSSSISAQPLQQAGKEFVLEFLPDGSLAIAARKDEKTVTIIDLRSGVPQLIIDTPFRVHGLRVIETSIVVIGEEKVIAWNLPGENPDVRMNVEDSTRIINFGNPDKRRGSEMEVVAASISRDFRYVALSFTTGLTSPILDVYCTSTGQKVRNYPDVVASALWFGPGEDHIYCATDGKAEVTAIKITQDILVYTDTAVLDNRNGSRGYPWESTCGYKVTDDRWIICRDGRRLLMLPPLWQSRSETSRVWNGKLLALLHSELSEPVILELEP